MPRLQFNEELRVRQYIISDPSTVFCFEYYSSLKGDSSGDWQQPMSTTPTHFRTLDNWSDGRDLTTDYIRPLPAIPDYNPYYMDPDYGVDPYWDIQIYNQHELQFHEDFNKQDTEIEPGCRVTDRTLNHALTKALVDPLQTRTNSYVSPAHDESADEFYHTGPQVSLTTAVEARILNTLVNRNDEPDYVPLTTNLGLNYKRRMLYFFMDFGELTLNGLVDTGALSSAIPEADLCKIRLLAPQSIDKEGPAPNFQLMVANGQLETPKSTVELKFEVSDIDFHEIFIVMENPTSPLIGFSYLQRNDTILDMRQGLLNFPFFSMQLKTAYHKYTKVMEPISTKEDITIPPNGRQLISINFQMYADTTVTAILQPSSTIAEDDDVALCAALVRLTQGRTMIHVNNFTDHPYTLERGSQISVLTPKQMKFVKPIDPVITWHPLQDYPENADFYASSLSNLQSLRILRRAIRSYSGRPRGPSATCAHSETS